jgi:hypothetical protein
LVSRGILFMILSFLLARVIDNRGRKTYLLRGFAEER